MKIPGYTQGQLASAAVGTPGVDRSGVALGSQMQDSENQVASTELQGVQKERGVADQNIELQRQEQAQAFSGIGAEITAQQRLTNERINQAQAQKDAATKAAKHMADQSQINDLASADEIASHKALMDGKAAHQDNPEAFSADYQKQHDALVKGTAEALDANGNPKYNPEVIAGYKERMNNDKVKNAASADEFAVTQRSKNQLAGFQNTQAGFVNYADQTGEGFRKSIESIYSPDNQRAAMSTLGAAEAPKMLHGYAVASAKNYLAGTKGNIQSVMQKAIDSAPPDAADPIAIATDAARNMVANSVAMINKHPDILAGQEKFLTGFLQESDTQINQIGAALDKQMKAQEDHALTDRTHDILQQEDKLAAYDPHDNSYIPVAKGIRDSLYGQLQDVESKPPTRYTLKETRLLRSGIAKQDANIAHSAQLAKEAKAEKAKDDKAVAKEKATAVKETQQKAYDAAQPMRTAIDDATTYVGQAKAEHANDDEKMRRIVEATQQLKQLHDAGLTKPPGAKKDAWLAAKSHSLQSAAQDIAYRKSGDPSFFGMGGSNQNLGDSVAAKKAFGGAFKDMNGEALAVLNQGAPTLVQHLLDQSEDKHNQHEVDRNFLNGMASGITYFRSQHGGRPPTAKEMSAIIRPLVTQKILRLIP